MINNIYSNGKRWTSRIIRTFIISLFVISFLLIPGKADLYAGNTKYIILLVADGWGQKHLEATNSYTGTTPTYQSGSPWSEHWLSTYPVTSSYDTSQAWSDFNYVTSGVADSACSATSLYTGSNTQTRRISVSADTSQAYESIADIAKAAGMSSGAVSTVPVSHATPGAWTSHNNDRVNTFAIADEAFFGNPNYTGTSATDSKYSGGHGAITQPTDVVIGANGSTYVSSQIRVELTTNSGAPDKHVFIDKLSGDTVTDMINTADNVTTKKMAALFDHSYHEADGSGYDTANPTLPQSTSAALKVLNRNPNGFVLMVEGGAVDWAGHSNNMNEMIGEQKDFNSAVQTVIDWVEDTTNGSGWSNSLVIVTGDHEAGYLAAGNNFITDPADPRYDANDPLGIIGPVNTTTLGLEDIVSGTGGRRASWDDTNLDGIIDAGETVYWYWNSGNHTNTLIPLFVRGTGADYFSTLEGSAPTDTYRGKYLHSTDVFSVMNNAIQDTPCIPTGVMSIIPGQTLYGDPVDLSLLVTTSEVNNLSYEVREITTCEILTTGTYIDAENYTSTISQGTATFVEESSIPGYIGSGYLRSDGGESPAGSCPAVNEGKEYQVNFDQAGTYNIWLKGYAATKQNDSIYIGLDGSCLGSLRETPAGCVDPDCDPYLNTWVWTNTINVGVNSITIDPGQEGLHTLNVWIREPDHLLDGIYITQGSETPTDVSHGTELNPTNCSISTWSGDEAAAQSLATGGWTSGLKELIVSGDDVTCLAPIPTVSDTFTFDSNSASSNSLIISNNFETTSSNPTDGDPNIVMQRFQVDSNSVPSSDNQVELASLTLVDDGDASSISNAKIYISETNSSTLPLDAVLIGSSGLWDGSPTTITLNSGNRTVVNGTSKYIYVVYDLITGQAGNTIKSRVSGVFVSAPDIGSGNAGTSNLLTIQACIQTGSISITPGQTLHATPVDVASLVTSNNATNLIYDVSVESGGFCNVDPEGTFIHAENFTSTLSPNGGSGTFTLETTQTSYLGTGYLKSNGGSLDSCPPDHQGQAYQVNFPQAGVYNLWMRGFASDGQSDSIMIGLDGACTGALNENGVYNAWTWSNAIQSGTNTINITTAGLHTINVWVREGNHLLDGIYLTQGAEVPTDLIHGAEIDPTYCPSSLFTGSEAQAQSIDATAWPNGTKILTVTGADAICGDQLPGSVDSFIYDSNDLPTSTITAPTDGLTLTTADANPFTITGTASDADSVNHIEVSTDGGQTWNIADCPACAGVDVTWTYSWTLPANGSHTILSKAVDSLSAAEIPGPGITVNVQIGNPEVDSTDPVNGGAPIIPDSTVTINWDRDVDCLTVTETSISISPSPTLWEKTSCSGLQAVFTPTGQTELTEYTISIDTTVLDAVGNPMAAPYQFSYTTGELTAPTSAITDPLDGGKINSSAPNPYVITGTANDNDMVQGVEVRIDGGTWTPVTSCTGCNTSTATWTYEWTLPADGFYTIESRATDASNNIEAPSAPITVEVDRTSPSISDTSPVNGSNGLALDLQVTLTWNENVNCSTVNTTNITSTNPGWTFFGCGGNTAFFTTSGQAEYTMYTVTVSTAVTNSGGTPMSDPYVLSYTTNKSPSLSINSPIANASVKAGESLIVNYSFDDPDHDPTVNFFYETDGNMQDGTPVPGACTGAGEGTNAICTWNIDAGFTPGNYYIYGVTNDGYGVVKAISGMFTIHPSNQPPTLSITNPDGIDDTVVDGDSYNITYSLTDPNVDDTITAAFYYDTDDQNYNGIPISGTCASAGEGTDVTCAWNTAGLSPGIFYIYGETSGDIGGSVKSYSSGQITINASNTIPTLNIIEPNGVNDTIVEGDIYPINYTLTDIDDTVTVAFSHDDNASGLNGTPIGDCTAAPEGTSVACNWDTAGMSAGSYYIYGITDGDRESTIIARYSVGEVTITVNEPSVSSNAPLNGATGIAPDSDVTITWDENIDCATVTPSSVTITPAPTSWTKSSCIGNQAVFTPDGQLNSMNYQVTVTTLVQDNDGNGMAADHVFSYDTNTPPSFSISSPNGSQGKQTMGNSFDIIYSLNDVDHTVYGALYYDTDNNPDNGYGTLLAGCDQLDEITDGICTWNNMPEGTFYIFGITDDGVGVNSCTNTTWDGINSSFLTDTNWSPIGVPQNGDNISFDGTSTADSTWGTNISLTSLNINSGYTGLVTIDASISISGDLTISDGTIVINSGDILVGDAPVSCGGGGSQVSIYSNPLTIAPAGITVTPTVGLVTTESGGTDTFTVVLDTQPSANVSIALSSDDSTEGLVTDPASGTLTFTPSDWETPQTVTVTGQDDFLLDGNVEYNIVTSPASSGDLNYNNLDASDVTLVTNSDDDIAGIIVTPTSGLITDEDLGTDTFTVVLNSEPTADVTIALSSDDTTEGTVSPASLTFTAANWNTAQTVTVTGVNDDVTDGNIAYNIVTAAAVSSDGNYSGINASDVAATNNDNDSSSIIVTPTSGLITDEDLGTDTFTVVLNSEPTADVTIALSSDDTTEGTVSPASLTFTAANWNTAQTVTVTGVNDDIIDGNIAYNIVTAAAVSSDGNYSGINASDVAATNNDNDSASIIVTPTSGLITDEDLGTDTFTVVLNSEPAADVTIALSSDDTTEGTVSPASLTFTAANWNTAQTVTVTGVNDDIIDGNIAYNIVTAAAVSSDGNYSGINASDVAATNNDNDSASIIVTPTSGLITDEDLGTDTFTVVLNSEPAADVTIALSSDDTTEGTVSPASLTFTAANWNTAQTVTVTGVNDDVTDGNIAYNIVTAAAVSSDGNYSGINASDVAATNNDNDSASIIVTPTSGLITDEDLGTDTFTVVLNSEPTADVTIALSSDDTTEGTVSPASLTFTAANWNTAQTVTVTGVNDDVTDGNIAYNIVTAAAVSSDGNYSGINASDVAATNNDNDSASIIVTPTSGLITDEDLGTDTFTVVLNSEPTADVTIALSSDDTTEGTVSPASLTFTAANWNTAQTVTVTGVNDDVTDGNIAYNIVTAAAVSSDGNYSGINASDVAATNNDNDSSSIIVTPTSGLITDEDLGTDTFTVVLNSEPTADVTIALSSDDTTEGTVSPASLTFTAANWNTAQTVTVTGVNDDIIDGNIAYNIVTAAAVSSDGNYSGINASDVAATNNDNDSASIIVTPTSGLITDEDLGTDTFTVVLNSEPTADVTIALSSDDTTEGTVSPASLTFTAANWNTAQTVTVTGVNDDVTDGNIAYNILTAAAVSSDGNYSGINASDVAATNNDNDTAGISLFPFSLITTEYNGVAFFWIQLNSEPTADVTIGISSDDTTEGTVDTASVTFTPANWNTKQWITVTGVDDSIADGDINYNVITAAAVSTDGNYNGINASDVSVTNTDNDAVGITVTPNSGLTTDESGLADTFTIVLDSEPAGNVTIGLSSSDTSEGTVSPASIIFTSGNWSTPQTVTVTGVNDDVVDGNVAYIIVTAPAVSSDAYSGLNASDVSLTNNDNDIAGITVTPESGLTTDESGSSTSFTVVLDSEPAADVTIGLSSDDNTEGTVSPSSLTFTSSNWNSPQLVNVTGVNDFIIDGSIPYNIITASASSSDGTYSGMNASDVSVTNNDNDAAGIIVTPTSGLTTDETGLSDSFTVVLNSEPAADVTIGISSDNTAEGTVDKSSLTFTAGNWNVAQTVTVTGENDFVIDGNIAYNILTAAAISTDLDYNGIDAANVSVSNNDNDAAGIIVTPTTGLITDETGLSDTFSVVLTSEPGAGVTIGISSSDTTEGTIDKSSLTFTAGNWNIPQVVTVTGQNDDIADGDIVYSIVTATATSTDSNYSGLDASDVSVVTNNDDDTAGITVDPTSGLSTDETGIADTFTVVLDSEPTADVTVGISSDDTTEGTVSPASLTFTSANWSTPQTVTVTGQNDSIADGAVAYSIITAAASSADAVYNGMNASDVGATNSDDTDTAGITVDPTSGLSTDETGTADTFTVVLDSEPTADVTVGISSDDTTEGTVSPASLTFTSANWSTPQTVTVTGQNDAIADGAVAYSIITAAASSADAVYNGMNASDVGATNSDDTDTAGITVDPTSGLSTDETGTADTFTVVLDSEPTADVTVGISSDDTTEGTVSPASLTFTSANWDTPQTVTVTGQNDALADGAVAFNILTAAATSTDNNYNGVNASDVSITNSDDDTSGINVSPTSGLLTDETGGTDTFDVVLNSEPTADVTIGISSDDTNEGTASPASLTFTSANWSTPQTVTVTGANDFVIDGNISYNIVTAAAVSTDTTGYSGLDAQDVSVTNNDNDAADIIVTPTSGLTTDENSGTDTFTVVLNSEPAANVTIDLTSDDTSEGTVSPAILTFTTANWNTPQTVTVTGVNDDVTDGNVNFNIVTEAAVSSDLDYNGINPSNVSVTNNDNDTTAINVTPTSGLTTTEAGGTDTFEVTLNSEPTADVSISLSSDDSTEGTVSPASLTFTSANWSTPQTVTVTGVNDFDIDGNIAYTIVTAAAVSSDTTGYNGLNASDVSVTNNDNDTAQINITPSSGLTTTEAGGTDTFDVVLNSKPTADVTIDLSSDNTNEGTVSIASLTFTVANWNTPQTVTVTGQNDSIDDGDISYNVITAAAVSTDTDYSGLNAADISVTNSDDDTAGITVDPPSNLTTSEAGIPAFFRVKLNSQPIADVTISLSSDDETEGVISDPSPATLTFTSSNWSTNQWVTVDGVNDEIADGDIVYHIVTAPATSVDSIYNNMNAIDVTITNNDND